MILASIIVVGILSLANIYLTIQLIKTHTRERSDMLDRLMSRDIQEYKEVSKVEVAVTTSEPVSLTDEEEYYREIEMEKGR